MPSYKREKRIKWERERKEGESVGEEVSEERWCSCSVVVREEEEKEAGERKGEKLGEMGIKN